MGRTPIYRTSIELEHHFSNIERTRTCSFVGNRTRTPYFWLRTIEHRTSNIVRPITNTFQYAADYQLLIKRSPYVTEILGILNRRWFPKHIETNSAISTTVEVACKRIWQSQCVNEILRILYTSIFISQNTLKQI